MGQAEVDEQLVDVGQRGDGVAGIEILAEADLAHSELAVERRTDRLLRDACVELLHACRGLVHIGLASFQQLFGLDSGRCQSDGAGQLRPRQARTRLGGGAIGSLRSVVQLDEAIARPHPSTGFEVERHDAPRQLRCEHDFANRAQ